MLVWWHLLSLDAPTVAAVWTCFVARCGGIHLPLTEPCAMFLGVWLLYVADRLLDARPLSVSGQAIGLEERHYFHHAHRAAFVRAACCTLPIFAYLVHRLPEAEIRLYVLLASMLGCWLLLVHLHPIEGSHRLPKELAVGLFFPAAVFLPTAVRLPALRPQLVLAALVFGGVCTLNCLFLFAWEHPRLHIAGHITTHWGVRHLHLLCLGVLVFCGLLCRESLHELGPVRSGPLAVACGLSCLLLGLLHRYRRHLGRTALRASADAALLTPCIVVLLPALHQNLFLRL